MVVYLTEFSKAYHYFIQNSDETAPFYLSAVITCSKHWQHEFPANADSSFYPLKSWSILCKACLPELLTNRLVCRSVLVTYPACHLF